ncbi:MAG: 23S rRNA (adenine(2030)-N(6))-methyltransferase RlmJ [Lysobacteraceae bacterium]|jgi:Protein involved in catabolism of external DNA|nr:23S rRNA (adenine(2030)-N(6))-methyltransferase RlmJ [Xanthomonadaceae bacterium]
MNYRHAFHAGNHADVLKHVVLLALLDALRRKDSPFFVLDTHAGRGRYRLQGEEAGRTGEAAGGVLRLAGAVDLPPAVARYLEAVAALNPDGGLQVYPGSPLLAAQALRGEDRLAACELQPEEAAALKALFAGDARVAVHARDGYAAVRALLPPRHQGRRFGRGLVLVDPPYEAQEAEYPQVTAAVREALERWPQGMCAVWYPIKQRRQLAPFFRALRALPARQVLLAELLVRPDDSPLRLNGSGMALVNPPWKFDQVLAPALPALRDRLGGAGASTRLEWIKREA